jgi:hypothetical protein
MFAEYRVKRSQEFQGLWTLFETVVTSDGSRIAGTEAFFRSKEHALIFARSQMKKGDTLFCEEDSI